MPYSETEINDACNKIISVQNIKDGYVRPMAWRGSEMMQSLHNKQKFMLL